MASRSWNRVELIGNLTRDPEMRYTPSGAAVVTFTIATNRTFISDGEKKEEADFHRVVAWNKLAELCTQLLKKGNRVFVSGRLQNRSWDTPEGQTRYITEIVIEDMILLTNKDTFPSSEGKNGEFVEYQSSTPAEVPSRAADEMPKGRDKQSLRSDDLKQSLRSDDPKNQESRGKEEKVESAKEEKAPKMEKEEVEDLDDLPF